MAPKLINPPSQETLSGSVDTVAPAELVQRLSRIDQMRDDFAKMDKVTVRLQEDTPVQINGYSFLIKGKTRVQVPALVAEVLEHAGLA